MNSNITRPPISSFMLYCLVFFLIPIFLSFSGLWFLISLPLMIIIHYGTHEAVHGTLVPVNIKRYIPNSLVGALGFSVFGHNYIFMRWSHHAHHKFGRRELNHTIDGKAGKMGVKGRVWYYLCLMGASCIYHEIAGYLYPLISDKYHILSRRFSRKYYKNFPYTINQIFVFFITFTFLYFFGVKFIICRVLFTVYWGTFQNVAHYGLEIGDYIDSNLASRTYRLPRIIEFFMFRGGAYHLEHHAFPYIPGPNLDSASVQDKLNKKLGFKPEPKLGLYLYIKDCLKQFKAPIPKTLEPFKPLK